MNRIEQSHIDMSMRYAYPEYTVPQSFKPFVLDQDGAGVLDSLETIRHIYIYIYG